MPNNLKLSIFAQLQEVAGIFNRKNPNHVFYAAVALVLFMAAFTVMTELSGTKDTVAGVTINSNLHNLLSNLPDGDYEGEYRPGKMAYARVRVTVKNKRIVAIKLLEHNKGRTEAAKTVAERVVEKQSLDVELVSGATVTSTVVLKAIENALGI